MMPTPTRSTIGRRHHSASDGPPRRRRDSARRTSAGEVPRRHAQVPPPCVNLHIVDTPDRARAARRARPPRSRAAARRARAGRPAHRARRSYTARVRARDVRRAPGQRARRCAMGPRRAGGGALPRRARRARRDSGARARTRRSARTRTVASGRAPGGRGPAAARPRPRPRRLPRTLNAAPQPAASAPARGSDTRSPGRRVSVADVLACSRSARSRALHRCTARPRAICRPTPARVSRGSVAAPRRTRARHEHPAMRSRVVQGRRVRRAARHARSSPGSGSRRHRTTVRGMVDAASVRRSQFDARWPPSDRRGRDRKSPRAVTGEV
jgi:hypothetical protein